LKKNLKTSNPFRRVTYISPISEIIDNAFQQSQAVRRTRIKKRVSREQKIAFLEKDRISILTHEFTRKIDSILDQFPWVEDIHPFYQELCNLVGSIDKIKQVLGRLKGISNQLREIEREQLQKISDTNHPNVMASVRKETGGRYVSLVKKAQGDVKDLIRIVKKLKSVPDFNTTLPTIVIAGAPNVGKSSLVRCISSGSPEVGEYPFTTKQIVFGHANFGLTLVQIVDTPGLLDRPFDERNLIERQSIASIKHISDVIVYMFDCSKDAELPVKEQYHLLEDISNEFSDNPTLRVLNKVDLLTDEQITKAKTELNTEFHTSTMECKGLEELVEALKTTVLTMLKTKDKFKDIAKLSISEEFLLQEEEDFSYDI
jgi:nucleolar GTP-binding protein